ncbi:KTSC domain containing protein [Cellulophaga phage phi46:3]|uniref:KTSC domain containing protein n=1 Tax=Cellulophaga phage phi46:3 TaxID=1327985 RepID=S0A0B0_9CAUD|nr:KTSC domain containing protein [Cellulophaga phage phi46:3]AGO48811.1 KTSC domain containing protein [Cellulophaga phage phi46:3]
MDKIEWIPVKSSQIKEIGHDGDLTLYIKFKRKDTVYSYWPIENIQFIEFKDAESIGSYFHQNLKMNKTLVITNEIKKNT